MAIGASGGQGVRYLCVVKLEVETIAGHEGERLYTVYYPAPTADARGTLLWVHGYAEHSGRYVSAIEHFHQAGWHSVVWDLRGHGRSTGRRGYISDLEEYLIDLTAVWTHWRGRVPSPVVLIGHSLGGLIVLRYRQKYASLWKPLATIVSAPLIQLKVEVPAWKRFLAGIAARFLPTMSLPSGLKPEDLTHDRVEAEAYARDPMVFRIATAGWFASTQRAQIALWKEIPLLTEEQLHFILPGADPICDSQAAQRFYDQLPTPKKSLQVYPESYHEPFHETFRSKVFENLTVYLNSL